MSRGRATVEVSNRAGLFNTKKRRSINIKNSVRTIGEAFGLRVCSDIPLQLLPERTGDTKDAIQVTEGTVDFPEGEDQNVVSQDNSLYFRQTGVGAFRIENDVVVVDRSTATTDRSVATAVLGRVINILLYQRGHFLLHGSVAAVDGAGVAFIGFSGSGKSSLAAALYADGHRVLADDTVVVSFENSPLVVPSFPWLKLTGWTLKTLELADDVDCDRERWYYIGDRFRRSKIPLESIYLVEEHQGGRVPAVEDINSATTMEKILQHSAGEDLVRATETERRHFRECAQVAEAVDVKRLYRPDDLLQLPELARTVENALK